VILTTPDGILTNQLAHSLGPTGSIHGIDASPAMIAASKRDAATAKLNATYEVVDCTLLPAFAALQQGSYDKVFSNAALHWILRAPETREDVFSGAAAALAPGGSLVFEMGGQGNVAELRAALLSAVGRRIGVGEARRVDPWFFPDEEWIRHVLAKTGFEVQQLELEYRPTRCEEGAGGGVEGWMRLMGKVFFDAVGDGEERERCLEEVLETLETVVHAPSGGYLMGYVRLRVKARKI